MKTIITEIKNTLVVINSLLEAEDPISDLEAQVGKKKKNQKSKKKK